MVGIWFSNNDMFVACMALFWYGGSRVCLISDFINIAEPAWAEPLGWSQ